MLSMFQGKKGFSVLFTNRESQLASPRPQTAGRDSRTSLTPPTSSRQSSHRCERCARLFRVHGTVPVADLQCTRCEFLTCPLCQEPRLAAEGGSTGQWQCCVCAMPHTLMRLFEQTRQGPSLVVHVMAFCDPRAERVLKSLFRTVSTASTTTAQPRRPATVGHPAARALPAPKRIAQHTREVLKSGSLHARESTELADDGDVEARTSTGSKGLRQRSKSGANQQPLQRSKTTHRGTVHEDSEEAAVAEAENLITGSLERTVMDALTFAPISEACRTVTQTTSTPTAGAFGLDVSASAAALVSISESSQSRSVGGGVALGGVTDVKSRSSGAFEREQPITPRTNVSAETRMTRTDGPTLSLSPLPKNTGTRSASSDSEGSCRSASPAPRFPSYTEFLGDQETVRQMQGGRTTNGGETLTVSPDSDLDRDEDSLKYDGVVELGAKRLSNTFNAASGHRVSGVLAADTQTSTPTQRTRRTIHDSSATRASTLKVRRHSSSSRLRCSASGFTPRSVYKRHSSHRSTSRLTAHSMTSSAAPSLPLYQPVLGVSLSATRASGSAVGVEVGSPALTTRKATPTGTAGKRRAAAATATKVVTMRGATGATPTGPRRAPLATRTAGRVLGGGGKASGTSTPLNNNSLHTAPSGARPPTTPGRFGRTNSGRAGAGFHGTASTGNGKLTRTASSGKHLSSATATAPSTATLKRTNSSAKHMGCPTPLARTQSRRTTSPVTAASGERAPALGYRLARTQSSVAGGFTRTKSGNKLTRTASSTAGMASTTATPASGNRLKRTATSTTTPLKRTKSSNPVAYARSATSAAAVAARARSGSQAQATPKRLVRVGSANTPISRAGASKAVVRASPKTGTTTPLRRTNTATPTRRTATGAASSGTTPLTRTATAAGRFERKATRRRVGSTDPIHNAPDTGATPGRTVVEDAPKLAHALGARRAAAASTTESTSPATARSRAAAATKTIRTTGGTGGVGPATHRFGRTATRTKTLRSSTEMSCPGTEHGSQPRSSDGVHGSAAHKTPTRRAAAGSHAVSPQHAKKVSGRTDAAASPGAAAFKRQNSSRTAFGRLPSRNAAVHK